MNKYRFIIKNTIKSIGLYIILIIINTSIILLGSFLLSNYTKTKQIDEYINSYLNIENLYSVEVDVLDEDLEEFSKLYIEESDGFKVPYPSKYEKNIVQYGPNYYGIDEMVSYISYDFSILEVSSNEKYLDTLSYIETHGPNNESIKYNVEVFISKVLGLHIKYPIIEGRDFIEEDFTENNNEYWNILAGYDFKEEFKLGDTLTILLPPVWGDDGEAKSSSQKLKIVGFIDKDTESLERLKDSRLISIDNKIVIPLKDNPDNIDINYMKNSLFSPGSLIITKNPQLVEERFLEEARGDGYEGKEGFVRLIPATFSYTLNRNNGNEESFNTYLRVLVGIILLAVVVTILSIWLIVRKNRRNYGILMLSGGTRKDIALGISIGTIIMVLLSYVIGIVLYYLLFKEPISIIVILIHLIIISIIVVTTSILILKNKRVSYFISFDENSN